MKKLFSLMALVLAFAMILGACGGAAPAPAAPAAETVELTLGSWRTDDVADMNKLLAAYKEIAPNVDITFQPTNPPDYNATLRVQLEGGTGPDIYYSRSFAAGEQLYNDGFSADVTDIPGLMQNFATANLSAWMAADGKMFAVPFAAVSHAVYYNKDIFAANGIELPNTFAEFTALCDKLKAAGITPLANGVADQWDILECLTSAMLPNYIGGAEERAKYESGEKKFNDQAFVDLLTDVQALAPYLPSGFEAVTYNDSQVLFSSGQAAMFIDGSWTMNAYKDSGLNYGFFAVPAREAANTSVCFHPDMAIAMNNATTHPEEAKAFLAWLCTEAGATTASQNLPLGYFPLINFPIQPTNPIAIEMLVLNEGRTTDGRFVFYKFMDLYNPFRDEVIALLNGSQNPQAASEALEAAAAPLRG
jgi:raffinose/stachyose/melibiose transport system substrate-binding protein